MTVEAASTLAHQPVKTITKPARLSCVGLVGSALLAALVGLGLLALMIGITQIPAAEVWKIVFTEAGERVPRIVIWEVRLPRFLLGALAGAALAVSGVMLQDALKNELAEPGLLGVATGASLVVATVLIFNIPVPSVFRTRALIFTVAIALNAAIVAVCGPIGFVALIAPHMTRGLLQSSDARQVLPISALLGGLLLTGSDLLARELFRPAELPVGLVTVVIGSPIALLLLRRLLSQRGS